MRTRSADRLCCRKMSVCLSVRPSHAGIVSKRQNISLNFFHRWIATPCCSFRAKACDCDNIQTGTSLMGASNAGRYAKITIFDQYLALSQKWYKIGAWNANRNSYAIYRTVPFFNDPERPLSKISRSRHYLTLNILETERDTDIVTMECTQCPTQQCNFE